MNGHFKIWFWFWISVLLISLPFAASASNLTKKTPVNVLTWWGYLTLPEVNKAVKAACHIELSVDEYYSTNEFLRRWRGQKQNYDIIIVSDTTYEVIKNDIKSFNSDLWLQSNQYIPIIKNHYLLNKFPHNVVYFVHSLTGFLWNPEIINLAPEDSILDIFQKAQNNLVVLIDDPVEANKLFAFNSPNLRTINSLNKFDQIVQSALVHINSNYAQIYQQPNFAFSYMWSGAAITDLKRSNKNYKFMIHPKLSYISSDLLVQLKENADTACVAKVLSSKKIISVIQNKKYYFSSYVNSKVNDPIFKNIFKYFIRCLPMLSWLETTSLENFERLSFEWELIKINQNTKLKNSLAKL